MPDRNQGTSAARFKPAVILFTFLSFLILVTWSFSPGVAATGSGLLSLAADDDDAISSASALAPAVFLPLVIGGIDVPIPFGEVHTGEGTYYDATGAGNCSFDASPDNLMVAAMNHTDYDNAALCGAYVQVTGPKGVVVVRIVDRCPECPAGHVENGDVIGSAQFPPPPQQSTADAWRIRRRDKR